MNIWFTSDHHFGHANIIKYCNRPFSYVHEMHLAMEAAWNRVVEQDDLVYYLGDFAMNAALVPKIAPLLHGRKILIPGNHDKCWKKKDTSGRWHRHYLDAGFEAIEQEMWMDIAGESVLLNHLPYRNEADPDQRFFEERPVDKGGWLIHGHVHQRWKVTGRQINVSVEVWNFEPVSVDTIADIIRQGPVVSAPAGQPGAGDDGY
ncbi:MAG TPA: metallophosphoesterase family protein [Candidatus Obscuribacterales bacterium]